MNKHQKVFKEVLKNFNEPTGQDSVNLYLTYRGIKKSSLFVFKKKKFEKIVKFCKKHKLHCVYKKRNNSKHKQFNDYYDIIISRKKIPKNIFVKEKSRDVARKIGNALGFPKVCIDDFIIKRKRKDTKKRFGHEIEIYFILKNNKQFQERVYVFVCDRMCYRQMKNMTKKIYNEFNKNLKNLFSYYSIRYNINYNEGYSVG